MTLKDHRDYDVTGATPVALDTFERALAAFQSWRTGAEAHLELALLEAPSFTMAHVLSAYLFLCSRDVRRVRLARPDWAQADDLQNALMRRQDLPTRHGETTRLIGLPACRAIIAFGRGDYVRTIELLGSLPAWIQRIGGSHAQRDVLYLTLLEAIERIRRPQLRIAA